MQLVSGLSYSLSEVGCGFYVLSDPGYWAGPWAGAHLLPMSIMPDQLLDRRGSLKFLEHWNYGCPSLQIMQFLILFEMPLIPPLPFEHLVNF